MPKLVFNEKESRDILFGDNEDFKVVEDKIDGTGRWTIEHVLVVQQISTGNFYITYYSEGATEQQDQRPFEYEGEITWDQVEPVEKTVVVYELVK